MAPPSPSSSVAVASERRGGGLMHGRTRRGRRSKSAEAEMAPLSTASIAGGAGDARHSPFALLRRLSSPDPRARARVHVCGLAPPQF